MHAGQARFGGTQADGNPPPQPATRLSDTTRSATTAPPGPTHKPTAPFTRPNNPHCPVAFGHAPLLQTTLRQRDKQYPHPSRLRQRPFLGPQTQTSGVFLRAASNPQPQKSVAKKRSRPINTQGFPSQTFSRRLVRRTLRLFNAWAPRRRPKAKSGVSRRRRQKPPTFQHKPLLLNNLRKTIVVAKNRLRVITSTTAAHPPNQGKRKTLSPRITRLKK